MPDTQHSQAESSQAEKSNSEKLPLPSPSKGMSEAKVEQQSTETLSFRCWCERCRLTRGRIVKQTQVSELGWGEGSTFNSATVKQLQELNNKTDLRRVKQKHAAFTLAEVLITLGIIGVVAALTLPALLTNVQAKIRAEQVRTAKYKFTKATEKMNSLGLIGPYDSTDAFVDELQKHLKISKRCDVNNLRGCWPYETITTLNGEYKVSDAKTGAAFMMKTDADNDYSSNNVGIVTADGVPIILNYNKKCTALDAEKQYAWSTEDNKPVTNATAGCVAAIFEVNGTQKPNKFKQDVIAFNIKGLNGECAVGLSANGRCFSSMFVPKPLSRVECEAEKDRLGLPSCVSFGPNTDYWAGAAKQCNGLANLPTMSEIETMSTQIYKNGKYDTALASSIGLPQPYFELWSSNMAAPPNGVLTGVFNDNGYSTFSAIRFWGSSVQAICAQ